MENPENVSNETDQEFYKLQQLILDIRNTNQINDYEAILQACENIHNISYKTVEKNAELLKSIETLESEK